MTKTIIHENQTGLLVQNGRVVRTLSAGTYRSYNFRNETIFAYPTTEQMYNLSVAARTKEAAQITVDVSLGVTIENALALNASGRSTHEIVQQVVSGQLQESVKARTLAELLETELSLNEKALNENIASYGLKASVRILPTIRLPRNLQNAIDAQEVARQRAKAELEEARGRSAVIRHYANVAKVTKDNPDLLRLLLGQKAKSINVAFDASTKVKP